MYFYVIYFYYGGTIDNEEIRKQIEILRNELRALGNSFVDLRQDDVRNVLGEQVRTVLLEKSDRFFSEQNKGGTPDRATVKCKEELDRFLEENINSFKQSGKDKALKALLAYEHVEHAARSKEYSAACKKYASEMFEQLRSYFDVSDRIVYPIGQRAGTSPPSTTVKDLSSVSPQMVEIALSPLASSWRIVILTLLMKEDDGLAELGRKIGLKKGHAQFHIKALIESGYIRYERKSRLYSITAKGSEAYEGVMALVQRLNSI